MGGPSKPHAIERSEVRSAARAYARAMVAGKPDSLTKSEVNLEHEPLTRAPESGPVPVYAWVRYGAQPVRTPAWATMWTERATKLRWPTPHGIEHTAWVWASAVSARRVSDYEIRSERSREDQVLVGIEHAIRALRRAA